MTLPIKIDKNPKPKPFNKIIYDLCFDRKDISRAWMVGDLTPYSPGVLSQAVAGLYTVSSVPPDRPFRNFRAPKQPRDQQTKSILEMTIDGF